VIPPIESRGTSVLQVKPLLVMRIRPAAGFKTRFRVGLQSGQIMTRRTLKNILTDRCGDRESMGNNSAVGLPAHQEGDSRAATEGGVR